MALGLAIPESRLHLWTARLASLDFRERSKLLFDHRSLCVAALMMFAPLAAGAQTRPSAAPGPNGHAPIAIPRANFIADMTAQFQKLDANRDGVVTRAEIEAAQQQALAAISLAQTKAVFARIDADHNGQISFDEFLHATAPTPSAVNAMPVLQRFDADHNGQISLVEYRAATLANFDRMDTDKDGVVSVAEQRAAGIVK